MKLRTIAPLSVLLASTVGLTACTAPVSKEGYLRETWSSKLRQYDMVPVFPPRADVQVGDVYLTCLTSVEERADPDNKEARLSAPRPVWIDTLPGMTDKSAQEPGLLSANYWTRVRLPSMPVEPEVQADVQVTDTSKVDAATNAKPGIVKASMSRVAPADTPKPADAAAIQIFAAGPLTTLMPVSFPEFFSVSATKAEASAIIPFPTILANVGVSASAVENVQISIPQGESYGLPAFPVATLMDSYFRKPETLKALKLVVPNAEAAAKFCNVGVPAVSVVREIYATRAIDVSMSFEKSAGANAGAGLYIPDADKRKAVWDALSQYFTGDAKPDAGGGDKSGDGKSPQANAKPDAPAQPKPSISQATAYLQQVNQLFANMNGDKKLTFAGGQVVVVSGNMTGVSMNRRFKDPVVIGLREHAILLSSFYKDDNGLLKDPAELAVFKLPSPRFTSDQAYVMKTDLDKKSALWRKLFAPWLEDAAK